MSSKNELDALTDERAAGHYHRHRDEIEREPGEPVDIESARPLSLMVSVRLRGMRLTKLLPRRRQPA